MNFSALLTKALPWIGAAATGNVPSLVAMAAKEVGGVLGIDVPSNVTAISDAVANATPEQIVALRDRESSFKERMQAMGFAHEEELAKIALQEQQVYVQDTANARHAHASDNKVFWLGIAVLVTFAVVTSASLWGSFQILTGGISLKDVSVVAAVSGFVGSLVGYTAANAQQVIAYFFGSSKGSQDKTAAMTAAIRDISQVK